MEKKALFCYGTLQSPMVMKTVTGTAFSGEEASLIGWARYRWERSEYPGIIPEEGSAVSGKIYWGIDDESLAKLDAFEGTRYTRTLVSIELASGEIVQAFAYAACDDCKDMLSDEPWDFDRFLQNGLERFINWFVEDRRDLFDSGDLS